MKRCPYCAEKMQELLSFVRIVGEITHGRVSLLKLKTY